MLTVLICNDSLIARKQVAKCLPKALDVSILFAKNGAEAITTLLNANVNLLLLDLNMPVLDGYGTLQKIQELAINTKTIVISDDMQPKAQARIAELGAVDFIQKPINASEFGKVLQKHISTPFSVANSPKQSELNEEVRDCYQEMVNVAMEQAGNHLARIMGVFVKLPIPNVNLIEVSELHMMLSDIDKFDTTLGICQGFLGDGISGEALFILSNSSFTEVAKILNVEGELNQQKQIEVLMDVASLLIGTCLSSIAQQLDMSFRQGHPVVLGQFQSVQSMINANQNNWRKTLAIEISYGLVGFNAHCDLILLFTEDSMTMLNAKLAYLLED